METNQVEILTIEERLRIKLARLVDRLISFNFPFVDMFKGMLLHEIRKADAATLEKVRLELLELLK